MEFVYGADNERRKVQLFKDDVLQSVKYYSINYEKGIDKLTNAVTELHYIQSPDGLVAIYKLDNSTTGTMHYVHTDNLGSIVALSDQSKNIEAVFSFDAWGRRRNPADWTDYTVADHWLKRGYTGHEHIDIFGLINMNGRLYDPMLGRMLSPDNYIQASDYTQTYNRYSYALNNPMKYTDPSGNFIPFLIMTVWTMASTGDMMGQASLRAGQDYWGGFGWGAFIGAVSSLVGYGAGQLAGAGLTAAYPGLTEGFWMGAVTNGANGLTSGFISGAAGTAALKGMGYDVGSPWIAGLKSGGIGLGIGFVTGGIIEGMRTVGQGHGSFWTGDYVSYKNVQFPAFKEAYMNQYSNAKGEEAANYHDVKSARRMDVLTSPERKSFGLDAENCEQYASVTKIPRRVVGEWYSNPNSKSVDGIIFHEQNHAYDYFTGKDSQIYNWSLENFGEYDAFDSYRFYMEYSTYRSQYLYNGTGSYAWRKASFPFIP